MAKKDNYNKAKTELAEVLRQELIQVGNRYPGARRDLDDCEILLHSLDAYTFSLEGRIKNLEVEKDAKEATIAMAVARLGGTVEGHPTHRINFLQRIDELIRKETENG